MTGFDDFLRTLLFRKFCVGKVKFDFMEALLAVCITGVGFALRIAFPDSGLPHPLMFLAEWYLAVSGGVLVSRVSGRGRRGLYAYGILMILPTVVMDGTILGNSAGVGALICISALLFLESGAIWLFTILAGALLLWNVKYIGLVLVAMVLWKYKGLRFEQLAVLLVTGAARFVYSFHAWFGAGYTLTTFHWANIYEIVGREAMQGQLFDPVATVGCFVAVGLLLLGIWVFCQGEWKLTQTVDETSEDASARRNGVEIQMLPVLRLLLFFGLAAGYFLPYMDQTYGYLFCVLAVILVLVEPKEFFIAAALQIVTFAGYQECVNGESMMPMWVFAVLQLLVLMYLCVKLLKEAKVVDLCVRKNWNI